MAIFEGAATVFGLMLRMAIRAYQLLLAPVLPPACRYLPSCSHYAEEAIARHGPLRNSSLLAAQRLCRSPPVGAAGMTLVLRRKAGESAMMDQKNLLVAIVVSVAILFGFQYLSEQILSATGTPDTGSSDAGAARVQRRCSGVRPARLRRAELRQPAPQAQPRPRPARRRSSTSRGSRSTRRVCTVRWRLPAAGSTT